VDEKELRHTLEMKILILGRHGQIGRELCRSLSPLGSVVAYGRQEADLMDLASLKQVVRQCRPDVIVNAAAYTAVDGAEAESEKVFRINAEAVSILADEVRDRGAWLIHYSTDYIFDGKKQSPYVETDIAEPLNVYGRSKLAGEEAIRASGCKHLIFRSSWVYSHHGVNFPLLILRRALERDRLEVVADNFGAPTSASLIADVSAFALYRIATGPMAAADKIGTYHLVAGGETSWYDYAKFIIEMAKERGMPLRTQTSNVFPVSSEAYKAIAKRPKNSRLDTNKISETFGFHLPYWQDEAIRFFEDICISEFL
jgi:dTDP-4-dehydrorhamnose reductase